MVNSSILALLPHSRPPPPSARFAHFLFFICPSVHLNYTFKANFLKFKDICRRKIAFLKEIFSFFWGGGLLFYSFHTFPIIYKHLIRLICLTVRNGIPSIFRLRKRRSSIGMNKNFLLFRVARNFFSRKMATLSPKLPHLEQDTLGVVGTRHGHWQCCGSGSTCFWASWIRIRLHWSEVWIRIWIRILLSLKVDGNEKLGGLRFLQLLGIGLGPW